MRISTKGRYGTRAMLALACKYDSCLVRATEISEEQGISLKYLETILASLKAAGLLVSARGKKGGYALARPPSEITLLDILGPLEGTMEYVHCLSEDSAGCERLETCVTRTVWAELKEASDRILTSTTLADLVERRKELDGRGLPGEGVRGPQRVPSPSPRNEGCAPGKEQATPSPDRQQYPGGATAPHSVIDRKK